jgi:hypothetical protein
VVSLEQGLLIRKDVEVREFRPMQMQLKELVREVIKMATMQEKEMQEMRSWEFCKTGDSRSTHNAKIILKSAITTLPLVAMDMLTVADIMHRMPKLNRHQLQIDRKKTFKISRKNRLRIRQSRPRLGLWRQR